MSSFLLTKAFTKKGYGKGPKGLIGGQMRVALCCGVLVNLILLPVTIGYSNGEANSCYDAVNLCQEVCPDTDASSRPWATLRTVNGVEELYPCCPVGMDMVAPPTRSDLYSVHATVSEWKPCEAFKVTVEVESADALYLGLLMYAVPEEAVDQGVNPEPKVGKFMLPKDDTLGKFWTPPACTGQAVMHAAAGVKNIRHEFSYRPPSQPGTGALRFRVLVKHGETNGGEFYWPMQTDLVVPEASVEAERIQWTVAPLGETCSQTCRQVGGKCNENAMASALSSRDAFSEGPERYLACMDPILSRDGDSCSQSELTVDSDGFCYTREDGQCAAPTCKEVVASGLQLLCACDVPQVECSEICGGVEYQSDEEGYECKVSLNGDDNIMLHYTLGDTDLRLRAVCTDCQGWLSVGFASKAGEMLGSSAVIGNPEAGTAGEYALTGKALSGVTPVTAGHENVVIGEPEIEQRGAMEVALSFVVSLDVMGGSSGSKGGGYSPTTTDLIWATGLTPSLAQHNRRGAVTVDFNAGGAGVLREKIWGNTMKLHAYGMFTALCLLFPLGAASAAGKALLGERWFIVHRAVQISGAMLVFIGFWAAYAYVEEEGIPHISGRHQKLGLAIFLLVLFQALNGMLRPHKAEDGSEETLKRTIWKGAVHMPLGYLLLLLSAINVQYGMQLWGSPEWVKGMVGFYAFVSLTAVLVMAVPQLRERVASRMLGRGPSSNGAAAVAKPVPQQRGSVPAKASAYSRPPAGPKRSRIDRPYVGGQQPNTQTTGRVPRKPAI